MNYGSSREAIARRAAADIPEGAYVNLGVGIPTLVADVLPPDREIVLHSENGVLGFGAAPSAGEEDPDLVNAGKLPITMLAGGSFFHHADSFLMIRGGHLDLALLGAFEVSERGDLANWTLGGTEKVRGVGGAMDLAVGAKQVWVLMEHTGKNGALRIKRTCTLPLTASGCVRRIYTNLATIDVTSGGLVVTEIANGISKVELQQHTEAPLAFSPDLRILSEVA